ncbi:hypothetical protein PFISCL1PPCAC_14736, partial [Pristionchus fissidentatus]
VMLRLFVAFFLFIAIALAQFGMGGFNNRGFNSNNRFNQPSRGFQGNNSYFRFIFAFTLPINLVTFYLIQTKTPSRSTSFKYLLLNLHFWVSFNDVFNSILFNGIPLFPIVGGFCEGLLCRAGVPMHYCLSVLHHLFTNIDFSLVMGFMYRHQTLLPHYHSLKMTKVR